MKKLILLLTLLSTSVLAFAQQGTLAGKVKDKKTGEPIIGAVVFITGSNKGSTTDLEGNYSIQIDPGVYKITASYVSYKPQNFESVQITAGKATTLDIAIEEATTQLGGVTITGTKQTNTDITLIKELKQSEVVVSGVSGEQITKSLDRDAAETVKRIPGVTVMNDRYIYVRGLSERYNTVMLNDALTPSTESDTKAFSFDILPTSVIDRIMIYKGGSPELPGEFGGGVIKVYTKNFADQNSTTLNISGSYRNNTTFNNFASYTGGKTDFLGFDDGSRTLPGSFPENLNEANNSAITTAARSLLNTWLPTNKSALPDLRMSLGLTRRMDIGDVKISNLTSLSYSNTRQSYNALRKDYLEYNPATQSSSLAYSFHDQQSNANVRLGVIHNWGVRFNNRHKLEFRNLFNQLGSSQVTERQGTDQTNGVQEQRNYALRYESRTIYSGQLQGTHTLPNLKNTFTWTTGYSYTNRNEPDYRRVRTQREAGSNEAFAVLIPTVPSLRDASRFYSKLNENIVMASGQFEHLFGQPDSTSGEIENASKLRVGFYTENKKRDFNARYMSYAPGSNYNIGLVYEPLDQIFSQQNIDNGNLLLNEGTSPSDHYTASNLLVAGYTGINLPLGVKFNLSGGVRAEYNRQQLHSRRLGGAPVEVNNPITRVLPSFNLTYNLTTKSLLRWSSSLSVNRPEFRELAPFTYYDFNTNFEITGNPNLKTPTIYNTDIRYELYTNPTEIISFGAFYKYFQKPIENTFENTNAANSYTFGNSDFSTSYGIETEIRKSLLDLSESKFVQNISLVLNATLIKSQVNLGDLATIQDKKRAMMGQSPYILNSGIYYQDDDRKWQVNLLYNVVGKRIFIVGNSQNPTVYEMPRNVLDLTLTKGIGERFEIKAGIQDLFNQKFRLTQDSDSNAKINKIDESIYEYRRGQYTTFGISYKL
ncbi:TonB-dependent receptor [Adhaeribacter radiodurans]|uniref:Carboxypeptidase-like regulatory domain-containing protein n=1 Tax=Adhaeribacter radiodurans TaxID=2745197 RepID=A0A7L7L2D3_9BACT|nr:TonB-dependent receptor [Adhaeribacter radiodurans]QMU26948.1 carboxypeptidase-like regulatory domain-containing protein [Adhaeribacter radiodurans]